MSKKSRGPRPASASAAPPSPRSGVLRWLAPVVLVLATVVAFLPTLENGFVNFDDIENFLNNRSYRGLGLTHLRWMFTTVNLGGLIPLTWMTLGFDYLIWGMPAKPAPASITTQRWVLRTEPTIVSVSMGRRVRGSTISMEMPSCASSSATSRAR